MKNTKLPYVTFSTIPLTLEMEWMYEFLFHDRWGWEKNILRRHPFLRKIYQFRTKKGRIKFLKEYILDHRSKNREIITSKVKQYKQHWRKIEKQYFQKLSEVLEVQWPQKRRRIKALVSINPICPRFLDSWSFSIYYNQSRIVLRETIMHEICHFMYFEKWKEVFPDARRQTFESPHPIWHLSEILAPVILQDPRMRRFLSQKPRFYNEHKRIKVQGITLPRFFERLYQRHRLRHTSIAEFLREAKTTLQTKHKALKKLDD